MVDGLIEVVGGAVAGVAVQASLALAYRKYKERQELIDNDRIDISGTWYAVWQTSAKEIDVNATQPIEIKQRGRVVEIHNLERSTEHPAGGYLWKGRMQFFQGRYLMGWYFALPSERNGSKGIMYFNYRSQRRLFYGKWAGSSYDADVSSGYLVISKSQEEGREVIQRMIEKNPNTIRIDID